jgi:TonB-linked SusC/RagA family outer membrane protein
MRKRLFKTGMRLFFTLFAVFSFGTSFAQQGIIVKGLITNSSDTGLPNVSIRAVGTGQVINSDTAGHFQLSVPAKEVLELTSVGFKTTLLRMVEHKPNSDGIVFVRTVLQEENTQMDEVVVVGFGTQKKTSMVSSITSVDVKQLKTPTSNLTNALAGKVSGLIAFQTSGEPGLGTDNSTFYIRGLSTFGTGKQDPLILIDGVESSATDMARLQPDDISDFSVLKDAAASAVYGARGANGVVLINTKSGKTGKTNFNVRSENRVSTNTSNFKFVDNITYMNTANEATLTRSPNAILPYSVNKINHTAAGDDPNLYPNNNWIDMLIKKYTMNQGYNMSMSGGSAKARYYVAGTYNIDHGVLKVDPINDFNNNIRLNNYSIRSNVNINLTESTELVIRMYGQFDDYKGPLVGPNNENGGQRIFNMAIWSNPVMFPAVYPSSMLPYIEHPLFGSTQTTNEGGLTNTLYVNPYAEMVRGFSVYKTSNIQPQLELNQNLNFITPGLKFRGMAYLKRYSLFSVNRSYNPFYYQAIVNPQDQSYALKALNDGSATSIGTVGTEYLGYSEGTKDIDSRIWVQGALDYNHNSDKHAFGGMLISYASSYEKGNSGSLTSSLPQRNAGVSGRFTYGFDNRYLAEFNFGYNGSERFAQKNRWGFFPSAGIAYRISNEKFFEPLLNKINDLKFRFTYGIVGNDQIGNINDRFFYLSNINMDDGGFSSSFGRNEGVTPYSRPGISVLRYANNEITWEKSKQINLGMDLHMFNNSFELIVDAFKQYRSGILMPKTYIENASGFMVIPFSNYGKAESQGIDLSMKYEKSFNKNLWANVRGTFTYTTSKKTVADELKYDSSLSHLSTVGHSLSQWWGHIAERLFIDQKEVANSPVQFGDQGLLAGDIKYRDINGDGVIDSDDRVPLGYPTQPEIIYGFGASLGYKSFDLSFYFQGSARSSFFINPQNIQPFFRNGGFENGHLQVISDSHWSEDNRDSYAFWPRLSTWDVPSNNMVSTWWMRKGNFLRLKSVDAGYTFGNLKSWGLNSARLYFSATNLLMFSNFKMWDVEMGGNGLGYPIQSVYALGLQVSF